MTTTLFGITIGVIVVGFGLINVLLVVQTRRWCRHLDRIRDRVCDEMYGRLT